MLPDCLSQDGRQKGRLATTDLAHDADKGTWFYPETYAAEYKKKMIQISLPDTTKFNFMIVRNILK